MAGMALRQPYQSVDYEAADVRQPCGNNPMYTLVYRDRAGCYCCRTLSPLSGPASRLVLESLQGLLQLAQLSVEYGP